LAAEGEEATGPEGISENRSISKEIGVHGQRFASIFDGYFSSPEVAWPLVEAVLMAADATHPQVIADLGGGTGFVLEELLRGGLQGVRLVNVEASPKQLAACTDRRIIPLQLSVDRVTRKDLQADGADTKLLLIARSVLHYFGRYGLGPLLSHIRGQLRPGEFFIHHSGAFSRQQDADVINHLYARMDSEKWFFTVDELKLRIEKAGFRVHEATSAPGLGMSSADLSERYGFGREKVASIAQEIEQIYGHNPDIFVYNGREFKAYLQASVFICEAVKCNP
jgi:SAM-dependent methyltransferase